MITPPYLQQGDTVAIIATARKVLPEEILPAKNILSQWGLHVIEGKSLYKTYNQFAGSDKERLKDLQWALDDPEVKAVLFARGGYGSMRIIEDVLFKKYKSHSKWLIGFSDITTVHLYVNVLEVESLHAPMAFNFSKTPSEVLERIKSTLFGQRLKYVFPLSQYNKQGMATGQLVGGNLSLIYAESAADPEMYFDGKILFIEDLDEYLYHVDRMLVSLKRSGKLANLAGLIVGAMNDMRDNTKAFGFKTDNPFGKTAEEIISEHVAAYNYPVCFNFPAGHIADNNPLIFGREVELFVGENATLLF